jgi:hypothetical protein
MSDECIPPGAGGARRIGSRRPGIDPRDLAEPPLPSLGRGAHPQNLAAGGSLQDFIVAASKAYGEALISEEPRIQELLALHAMVSRMRLSCSPRTVARAEEVIRVTIDTYFAPNKTVRELNELMKSGAAIDPIKDFAEAAREDLRSR